MFITRQLKMSVLYSSRFLKNIPVSDTEQQKVLRGFQLDPQRKTNPLSAARENVRPSLL